MRISVLSSLQHEQAEWQKKNFPHSGDQEAFEGIVEEVGELAHARLKMRQGIRGGENHLAAERDAIGDIVIFLLGYCNYRGISLENVVLETWDRVIHRDWISNPDNAHELVR